MSTSRPAGPGGTPPRLLVALALVAAAALTLLAVMVTMAAISPGDFQDVAHFTFLDRVQIGTGLLDAPVLLLVPVAVLLARLVERGTEGAPSMARTVLASATVVGAGLALFVLLRLVGHLGGQEYLVGPVPKVGNCFHDVGGLLGAVTGPYWAYYELQRTSSGGNPAEEGSQAGRPWFPPPPPGPPGTSPPPAARP
ncbi:MAG TPA: hypothetical protein VGV63_04395 [Acidimicrobiales bacterium]|nr:hypothetical protein [Acidimicrobiales bacterium]